LVNLLTGELDLTSNPSTFMTKNQSRLVEFYEQGVLAIGDHEGAMRPSTGDTEIDDLINMLTHPDPNQRPHDLKALLDLPLFGDPVGSDGARKLLVGIMTKNTDMISDGQAMVNS
jgi:hypothetical protein